MRLEPREHVPMWMVLSAPIAAIAVAMVLVSGLVLWTGESVWDAYAALFKGAFGSRFGFAETLTRATPVMLTGLAAAVAFRARFWNIGAEGQLYCGALAATFFGTGLITLPPVLMIPFLFLMGALAGGAALALPVYLKTKLKVDEVVTTLLLNFIILLFVNYLLEGPLRDPMSMGWPQAAPIIDEGVLPRILAKSRLHLGLIVAIVSAVLVWVIMRFTVWGYEIRAVGHNPSAATFTGISINLTVLRVALLSGGLAGFAGVTEVAGLKGYLTLDLSPGFGYSGIAVAMLANLHPLGVIASAIFLAGIYVGADSMSRAINIPNYIADVLVAVSVLAVLVSLMLTHFRIKFR
ncbi:MAG: ABC transporter permease [Rhodospirillaceae bacterium]|jgi:general nucleoside transport system permease protein|nr:ABC transporter permease [Rhodospirillaceae bacterium]MBT5243609.1 ABC transporter permease [Rhodospirillaceae bacterium]MBT5562197.1 ABC transporter permease [Rhodospirillaceae bacterium]MBT6242370.1 ABC transporter permease [Rhodospirillaceae bacterium]MBT7138924.1 ABC transporter permease [Rhodospirillaceae bacterium]